MADGDSGAGARGRVEKEMGSECIRNDLYVLSANDLMGSRPTINGTSLSTVNHSVGILEVAVPLSEVSEDLGDCAYLDACAGRVEHNLDLSHLRMMQPTGFGSRGSNLSSAQALAAVNACLALDPQAEGNTIGRTTLEVILGKFLPNTERERILDEAGDDSGRCDAAAVRAAILKSAEVLQLLQERREANLDHFSLNDLRELRVSVEEICWNRETKPGKIWIETGLRDAEQDLNRWERRPRHAFPKIFRLLLTRRQILFPSLTDEKIIKCLVFRQAQWGEGNSQVRGDGPGLRPV